MGHVRKTCRNAQVMLWPEAMADSSLLVLSAKDDLVPSSIIDRHLCLAGSPCKVLAAAVGPLNLTVPFSVTVSCPIQPADSAGSLSQLCTAACPALAVAHPAAAQPGPPP